jgi:GMP synthase (glutamine-hydrolysing)
VAGMKARAARGPRPFVHPAVETLLIVDFGSQYNLLIARRIREMHVFCEVVPPQAPVEILSGKNIRGIILSGGPASIYAKGAPKIPSWVFDAGVPVLGICYGMQAMAHQLGGRVAGSRHREYGRADMRVLRNGAFFKGLPSKIRTWMSHGDHVTRLPRGFRALGSTDSTRYAACEDPARRFYGVQFHPEVAHTQHGDRILSNFIFGVCRAKGNWSLGSFIEKTVRDVRRKVGQDHVILGLSGGVDSSVVAALLSKAIGKQLTCIFVDNGLLRKNEAEEVRRVFTKQFKVDLRVVDASRRFLDELEGEADPEEKRKIIGRVFIEVFQAEARKIKNAKYLAQGTLYPDVIESRSAFGGPSATIKTHHNVGGLPEKMHLKLIEPLRELFKDEVREVGLKLGLSKDLIGRHPFPGPGLAVRVLGEVTKDRCDILREADARFIEELKRRAQYDKVWQAFSVLLPVKTVGVMGDERTYENVLALRAVTSRDGMTADWARLPEELLAAVSNRVINEVKGVNRVVYDISSKPPATIEWE